MHYTGPSEPNTRRRNGAAVKRNDAAPKLKHYTHLTNDFEAVLEIGAPTNFKHEGHIGFDQHGQLKMILPDGVSLSAEMWRLIRRADAQLRSRGRQGLSKEELAIMLQLDGRGRAQQPMSKATDDWFYADQPLTNKAGNLELYSVTPNCRPDRPPIPPADRPTIHPTIHPPADMLAPRTVPKQLRWTKTVSSGRGETTAAVDRQRFLGQIYRCDPEPAPNHPSRGAMLTPPIAKDKRQLQIEQSSRQTAYSSRQQPTIIANPPAVVNPHSRITSDSARQRMVERIFEHFAVPLGSAGLRMGFDQTVAFWSGASAQAY